MKLKAVATRNLPNTFIAALNSSAIADQFRDKVAIPHLNVDPDSFGAATHYVQETDLSIPTSDGKMGIEVTLSKVSVTDHRSPLNFKNALAAVLAVYTDLVERELEEGKEVQLFCVLALDDKIKFAGQEPTSLVELSPVTVQGHKQWFPSNTAGAKVEV